MRRSFVALVAALTLAGCPTYDRYSRLSDQAGYMPGDQFAGYGVEQAEKVAIGRALARAYKGHSPEAFATQVGEAVAYARSLPNVADVKADSAAYFLTVKFKSGWRTAVLPLDDGIAPEATPGLAGAPN